MLLTFYFYLLTALIHPSNTIKCVHDKVAAPKMIIQQHPPDLILYQKPNQEKEIIEPAPLRIIVDHQLVSVNKYPAQAEYLKNELMPPVIKYFQETLSISERYHRNIIPKDSLCEQYQITDVNYGDEDSLHQIFQGDLLIFPVIENSQFDYVAVAQTCVLAYNKRPLIGMIKFNVNYFDINKPLESNLIIALHEMTHILGFSKYLYPYFQPDITEFNEYNISGLSRSVIEHPSIASRMQKFFNCTSIKGGILENDEDQGKRGSHWERSLYFNEYMTATEIYDPRVSEFTLAMLEASGWYHVNYEMAEPLSWGRNEGCNFFNMPCYDKQSHKANFHEFCSNLQEKGCYYTRKAKGICGGSSIEIDTEGEVTQSTNYWDNKTVVQDHFADNCPYMLFQRGTECNNPHHQKFSLIPQEQYGGNSACFSGNLKKIHTEEGSLSYCFSYKCHHLSIEEQVRQKLQHQKDNQSKEDSSEFKVQQFWLQVDIGSSRVHCRQPGKTHVGGFKGLIDCPDPTEFCTQIVEPYCKRGCMGNGICDHRRRCVCNERYKGDDCSILKNYVRKNTTIFTPNVKFGLVIMVAVCIIGSLGGLVVYFCKVNKRRGESYKEDNSNLPFWENSVKSALSNLEEELIGSGNNCQVDEDEIELKSYKK